MKIKTGKYYWVYYKCREKSRSYSGPVLVKEYVPDERGYSCIIANKLRENYINYHSGSLFFEKDFLGISNKEEFLLSRIQFLKEQIDKDQKELDKICKL